jgi:hypothetical protein
MKITKEHPATDPYGSILRFPFACSAVEAGATPLRAAFLRTATGAALAARTEASVFGVFLRPGFSFVSLFPCSLGSKLLESIAILRHKAAVRAHVHSARSSLYSLSCLLPNYWLDGSKK